jgi:hypothetical protein
MTTTTTDDTYSIVIIKNLDTKDIKKLSLDAILDTIKVLNTLPEVKEAFTDAFLQALKQK